MAKKVKEPVKINIHCENQKALAELMKDCTYEGVIHKGAQWLKFYKNKKYFCAMQVTTNVSDEVFVNEVGVPF